MSELIENGVAVAVFKPLTLNGLSQAACAELIATVDRFEADRAASALVLLFEGPAAPDEADLREFGRGLDRPDLHGAIARLEGASKPIVAALHGAVLGAGLELALGCHYRVADAAVRLGLPQVKLGAIPGQGGTQRLPRLIGLEAALRMISLGDEISAKDAAALGLVDEVIADDMRTGAAAFARRIAASGARRVRDLPAPADDPAIFDAALQGAARKRRAQDAPKAAVDAARLAYKYGFDDAVERERAIHHDLLASAQSKALRHVLAAELAAVKIAGPPARSVDRVGVVGLGVMGMGIATALADSGLQVVVLAHSQEKLDKAMTALRKRYDKLAGSGRLAPEEAERRLARIVGTTRYSDLGEADLVIEAVSEAMPVKLQVFRALDAVCKPGAILATNTSYLDIDAIAAATARPGDVCGMHFFNPADVMRLLENVQTERTAPDVLTTIQKVGAQIGKLPVLVGVSDGFLVNRMLSKRSREAAFLLEEGATPQAVDAALLDYGFPMGPFALADLAGIDVQYAARQARQDRLTPRERRADFVDQLAKLGRLGRKTGRGWYLYGEDGKARPDPEIDALIVAHAQRHGVVPREIASDEIVRRCLFAMVNEGAKILDEGVAARPHDIDAAMVNGIGFPAYRGGPMFWADQLGLPVVLDAVRGFAAELGETYWRPATSLVRLAREGRGFYDA